jgi:tRNA-Thr(GGU) m(6)t(6)A37 methyltransferase TsaA
MLCATMRKDESMKEMKYKPIGIIHSPFKEPKGTPIQPAGAKGINGTVEIFPEYVEGLKDIGGFSHIILLYHFHLSKGSALIAKPYMDNEAHGVFAMRGPSRPNPIGISVVCLVKVEGNMLHIRDVDIVDGTPLLDVKPYIPEFDIREVERIGWLEKNVDKLSESKDNGRFTE